MGTDGDQPVTTFSILNIQGLRPRTVLSKIPYIQDLIQANNQMCIAITETWLRDRTDPDLCVQIATQSSDKNANIIRKRGGRHSGGVAIYLRNDIAHVTEKFL